MIKRLLKITSYILVGITVMAICFFAIVVVQRNGNAPIHVYKASLRGSHLYCKVAGQGQPYGLLIVLADSHDIESALDKDNVAARHERRIVDSRLRIGSDSFTILYIMKKWKNNNGQHYNNTLYWNYLAGIIISPHLPEQVINEIKENMTTAISIAPSSSDGDYIRIHGFAGVDK
jgi:hypothetical protein